MVPSSRPVALRPAAMLAYVSSARRFYGRQGDGHGLIVSVQVSAL